MQLKLGVRWQTDGRDLDARVAPLLRAIAKTGSLNQAVRVLRMSYRHAWGLLGVAERALGQPLVDLQRGRGARLSSLGEKFVAVDDAAAALLDREFGITVRSLSRERALRRVANPLVVHASHDLALSELRDLMSRTSEPAFELQVRGSLECLADLAHDACEIAGSHVPQHTAGQLRHAAAGAHGRKRKSPADLLPARSCGERRPLHQPPDRIRHPPV